MYTRILVFGTKILIELLRLLGKNASALPGLIIEKLSPNFLQHTLKPYENRIVIITGTNGKTTTTKMVVHGLRSDGDRVVTNATGSNMTRGLIAALIDDMSLLGSVKPTDWFVFEMDEAYAPQFTKGLRVKAVLGLNVLRDQLDRYGEIDKTAGFIQRAAAQAEIFVYNVHDPLLASAAKSVEQNNVNITSFGVVKKLTQEIKNEQNMFTKTSIADSKPDVTLTNSKEKKGIQQINISINNTPIRIELKLPGLHNALNATAACALIATLKPAEYKKNVVAINTMHPPFGRGEKLVLNNKNVTVALVKNPSGFTHNLETFVQHDPPEHILFVINDRFADGRDVSWLWDVNFEHVISNKSKITCSGLRAYDMALRLKHDGYESFVEVDVDKAVARFMNSSDSSALIIPTYTALYEARAALTKYGKVPRIW